MSIWDKPLLSAKDAVSVLPGKVHNGIIFSNASCVEDGKFNEGLKSKGNIIHVDG